MAIHTKDLAMVSAKWSQRASGAGADYTNGVKATTKDWAALTSGAEQSWKDGVSQAAAAGRFGKHVIAAGTSKWQSQTLLKGPTRYTDGVTKSKPQFEHGFGPFLAAIQAGTLPPRGAKGNPSNYQRVSYIGDLLHKAKIGA